ncbi:response regulator transcription factor [Vagococcus sp. BWB3-3]|uniref:Response regulator transcription factor n=1 Tax=Vagococcus allomyrinae TaxID=2794353 RepID=A0A940P2A3_9ENTE|nr:response regulator transcription factor [Vagococcus allomyrinae]MBP1040144.1 response regulator transcription factor [Vagococcus allomyrinae]
MKRILIIEDDENICQLLRDYFQDRVQLTIVHTGTEGAILGSNSSYDLILLDLMLPGKDGELVLKEIRSQSQTPVIIMTAISEKERTVALLKAGANDYVSKPFNFDELEARIEVQFRNQPVNSNEKRMTYKNLSLIEEFYEIEVNGRTLETSRKEYQLIDLLLSHPTKIFSKENLYTKVWEEPYLGGENTLNVHLSNLRKKLKQVDPENEYIETVWGMGIRLAKENI